MANSNTQALRTVDELGRIGLPKTLRQNLGIAAGDQYEIVTQGQKIILLRHAPSCQVCNEDTNVTCLNKAFLCEVCREAIEKTLA